MVSKKQYQPRRAILLSGIALVMVVIASFMFLFLGGGHQSLADSPGLAIGPTPTSPTQNQVITPLARGPVLSVNPISGPRGTLVLVKGFRFGANEQVTFTFQNKPITPLRSPVTTNRAGTFIAVLVVPNAALAGPANITATGQTSLLQASFQFRVLSPLKVAPQRGRAGTKVTANGGVFTPNGNVQVILVCVRVSCVGTTLGNYTAAPNGTISGSFTIPAGTAPGLYGLAFQDSSGAVTTVLFVVTR